MIKRKIVLSLLSLVCVFCCAFALAACGGNENDTGVSPNTMLIAKVGEEPNLSDPYNSGYDKHSITYGESFVVPEYNCYLYYYDGDVKLVDVNDSRFKVTYFYQGRGTSEPVQLNEFPEKFLVGRYEAMYEYRCNADFPLRNIVEIEVAAANSGDFKVETEKAVWHTNDEIPNIVLKNPDGTPVTYTGFTTNSSNYAEDDSNGFYRIYYIDKEIYDTFTDEEKTDYDFMNGLWATGQAKSYNPNYSENAKIPVGNYVMYAEISQTHNYRLLYALGTEITVKDSFIDRTFRWDSFVLQDADGNLVADEDNPFMSDPDDDVISGKWEYYNLNNQGLTLICEKGSRCTVGGTVFLNEFEVGIQTNEDVIVHYSSTVDTVTMQNNQGFSATGVLVGNTLTLTIADRNLDTKYYWVATLTAVD